MRAKHLALLGVPLVAFAVAPVRASCAAPWLSIDGGPSTLKVGQTITIRAEGGWGDFGCDDVGGGGIGGCGGDNPEDVVRGEPDKNVEIRLYGPRTRRQERIFDTTRHQPKFDDYVVLDTVDANENGYFEVELQVPDVEPGRYALDTPLDYDDFYPLTIRTGRGRHGS